MCDVLLNDPIKATFSCHKLIPKKHSNDNLKYKFVIVHHFHHDIDKNNVKVFIANATWTHWYVLSKI